MPTAFTRMLCKDPIIKRGLMRLTLFHRVVNVLTVVREAADSIIDSERYPIPCLLKIMWGLNGITTVFYWRDKTDSTLFGGDLNQNLPFHDEIFDCILGLSVLEHLIHGCRFLKEATRLLKPGGHLILITPNLSAWFNIFLLGIGHMPSSGPHPDSVLLLRKNTPIQFRNAGVAHVEDSIPTDRHLVVFTYKVLRFYLESLGFEHIIGKAYGIYPFPKFMQPILEKIDPWHCHQMLFNCRK